VKKIPITVEDLLKIPFIWQYDVDKNFKTVLYSSNEIGIPQIYSIPIDLSSEPRLVTNGKDPFLMAYISRSGDKLIYFQDEAGNEIFNLFMLPIKGGEPKQLTDSDYRTFTMDWHPNGKEITRSYASMTGAGLETINLETGESFMLRDPSPVAMDLHYSHDGKWLAITNMKGIVNSEVQIININDPSDVIVYNISDKSKEGNPSWSPDNKKVAFLSDKTGWQQAIIQDFQGDEQLLLEVEKEEELAPGEEPILWGPNSDIIYYTVDKHGRSKIYSHPIEGKRGPPLPLPTGTIQLPRISKDGKLLTILHSSMVSPLGVYIHEIGTNKTSPITPRQFKIDLSQLKEPKSVWYDTFDGRKIHSWYIPAVQAKEPYPAVIYSHGGPWGQTSDSWYHSVFMHPFSQVGYAALGPNFRGSTGYGSEFQFLDIGDPGGGDLEDMVHAANWLKEQPEVDGSKIAIMGGSYGGYMTLMALTKKPDVFVTGISLVPVVDWLEMYKSSDFWFQLFERTLLGGPPRKKTKELYIDRSPSTHVENIKVPIMIMAGKADSRCPWPPIEKFINKLKDMNHPHELAIVEKAGHISALLNWDESIPIMNKMTEFLRNYLG
jgi:dipeptidyl aminopeptidase/acylaminoacyl peptidase